MDSSEQKGGGRMDATRDAIIEIGNRASLPVIRRIFAFP